MHTFGSTARLDALRSFHILDTATEPVFDTLANLAAHIFGVSTSSISFVDDHRQWFKARIGFDRGETPLEESFCRFAIEGDEVFVVSNAAKDERFADNPLVTSGTVSFYAGAPLITHDHQRLGTICVLDPQPREPSLYHIDMLRELARITMNLLDARRLGIDLHADKDRVYGLADHSPGGLFEFKRSSEGEQWLSYASRGLIDTLGVPPDVAVKDIGQVFSRLHREDAEAFATSIDEAYRSVAPWQHQFRVQHPTKGTLSILGVSHPVREEAGLVTWQGCLMDVTERVAEQERLEDARSTLEKQFRELSEYQMLLSQIGRMSRVGGWAVDLATEEVTWTSEVYAIHGVSPENFTPTVERAIDFCALPERERLRQIVSNAIDTGADLEVEYPLITPAGERKWVRTIGEIEYRSDGAPTRLIGSLQDVTEEQDLLSRALYLSSHDHMTGLPNRAAFFQRLDELSSECGSHPEHALLFFDLDHFKDINDAFGYEAGDAVIKELGRRLSALVSKGECAHASRFGGDEFGVLLTNVPDKQFLQLQARRIKHHLSGEMTIKGVRLHSRVSMGAVLAEGSAMSAASLFSKADMALLHAKQSGRGGLVLYTDELGAADERDHQLRREIVEGIERAEFEVHYQPIIDLWSGGLDGFEALLRWHHPKKGLTSAGLFAHLIDDPMIGAGLSDLVFNQVIETAKRWTAEGLPFGQIAINISSVQLRDPSFLDRLGRVVEAGLPASSIKLEITEGVLLGRTAEKAAQVLAQINEMGFSIALDDFGTGYASLVHLTQFPIHQLKVDMSFVRRMSTSEKDRTIVQTMCSLAEGLRLTVVTEGVEDDTTARMLRSMGCRFAQGWLYAKALSPAEAEDFIAANESQPKRVNAYP
jgi:diguanylate cyclase (GGDEF)-like protein